jgi:biopolymer transport protein ExbB
MSLLHLVRAPLAAALLALATLAAGLSTDARAQAAPAEAPAAMAAPATKEPVSNPYGLDALWAQGDFVARGTLIIMIVMSMGSWYIIFTKLFEQRRLMRSARATGDEFWNAGSVKDAAAALDVRSAFRFIAESGVKASERHAGRLGEKIDLHTWIGMSLQRAIDRIQSRLGNGLAFLATVGSTAPFIGLFGTVWGIYHALSAIGIAGQASIDKVAGPVGESLIMTAFGLAVAVPAVMGYNWLLRRNKAAMEQVRSFGSELHTVLLAGR